MARASVLTSPLRQGRLVPGYRVSFHRRWVLCAAALAALSSCEGALPKASPCTSSSCPAGQTCDASGQCAPSGTTPDAGAGCSSDADCLGWGLCESSSRRCMECLTDTDCPGGACTPEGACLPVPDSCQTAFALDLASGRATVRGDTSRGANDVKPPCAIPTSAAPDLVYSFTLTERRRIVAVAAPDPGSALQPVLLLRSACVGADPANNVACGFQAPPSPQARVSAEIGPGTFFLWIDGDGSSAGAFTLEITSEQPGFGDSCGSPRPVLFLSDELRHLDDTRDYQNDDWGTCGGVVGNDVVYELHLHAPHRVTAVVTPLSVDFVPLVYLRRAPCGDPYSEELACARAAPSGRDPVGLDLPRLEPGIYYLFVDGALSSELEPTAGEFQLEVLLSDPVPAPPHDQCAGAELLNFGSSSTLTLAGDTTGAGDHALGCGGTGPDVVYRLSLSSPRQVVARVSPTAGSALRPVIYLRKPGACASESSSDQVACNLAVDPGAGASLTVPNLAAGEYFLWVDGAKGTKGAFSLTVELSQPTLPPANDGCGSPQLVSGASGAVTVNGTTTGANDDATTCTIPAGVTSPDVVYAIDVPGKQSLTLDLQAWSGSQLRPVMALRAPSACGSDDLANELFCAYGDPQFTQRAVYVHPQLDPGLYYLWVEGDYTSHGPFTLRASLGPPIPPPVNDGCLSAPIVLQPGNPVTGDTRGAANDDEGSCGPLPGTSGAAARDVVYQFVLAAPGSVTLTAAPDPSEGALFRPVLYVRGPGAAQCGSTASADQRGCQVAPAFGGQAVLNLPGLSPGTYWVWVDGVAQSSGKFTLKLH